MTTGTVTLHRVLKAPPMRVYRAFIEADALAKWLPPVSKSLNTGLQEGTAELIKTAKALGRLNNSIESARDQLSWKLITIVLGIFAILMLGIIWLFSVYIKPLENIPQIESLRQQGIQFDIGSCTVGEESKPCVRVMKKQCGYGKNGDFCVIDPK